MAIDVGNKVMVVDDPKKPARLVEATVQGVEFVPGLGMMVDLNIGASSSRRHITDIRKKVN